MSEDELHFRSNNVKPNDSPYTLLLIHGAWHSSLYWSPLMEELSKHNLHTIGLDLPSHGKSVELKSIRRYSISDYTNAVLSFIDNNIENQVLPIGHSMGGAIVLNLMNKSSKLSSAVLLAPANRRGVAQLFIKLMFKQPIAYFKSIFTFNLFPFVQNRNKAFDLFYSNLITKSQVDPYLDDLQNESFRAAIDMLFHQPLPHNKPIFIIGGKQDQIFPPSNMTHISGLLSSKLELLSGGHNIHVERPEECANLINNWLIDLN